MTKNTYAIMGATGHIGFVVVEELLKKGHKVHAIGRDKNKLQKLKEKGAEIFIASADDATALEKAFVGCNAVFSLIPPGYEAEDLGIFQDKVGEAIKQAIVKSKVQHVVNLSSIGANLSEGTGPVKGLHRHEKRLSNIPNVNVLNLRPGYFMENLLWYIPMIKHMGKIGSPLKADLQIAMIATHDIGVKAAEILDTLKFSGQTVFELLGPKEITLKTATKALGKSIGQPDLEYVQVTFPEAEQGMHFIGIKPNTIKSMLEMYKTFNEGKFEVTQQITPAHRGQTTIEDFSKTFAKAFQSAGQTVGSRH
jgi:uncharacterized protein YbjT (DUF2867 family)